MHPAYQIFCRIFQFTFHLALPFLPYREPVRSTRLSDIVKPLDEQGIRSVLLVTDRALREGGITAPLEAILAEQGIRTAIYDRTRQNPTVRNVEEAFALYRKAGCEGLIAFGGGSSIDCAKAVGARVAYPNKSLDQLKGLLRVIRKIPTLIAIPTTAGTGSEVTLAAVITDDDKKHKYTINSFTLIPDYALLDPEVTYTLPPSLTATTGMDALTHAVEAYIGRSTRRETRRLALDATHKIFRHLETACREGNNRTARAEMLAAAYEAGIAFSKSYVGYIHAVAHSLGGQYNIPHGLANAVLLPIVLEAYGRSVHRKLWELGMAAGVANREDTPEEGAARFIRAIRELERKIGILETLDGIRAEDIPQMAAYAAKEANPLYPVPKLMDARALEDFYYKVAKEERCDVDRRDAVQSTAVL